jgi:AraC-like DNA-binding protein
MVSILLLIFTGLMGFVTLFIILFGYKSNRVINIYLALIIFFCSLRLFIIGVKELTQNPYLIYYIQNHNLLYIYIGPCFYLYFDKLIKNQKKIYPKDLYHFIIPTLFVLEGRLSILRNLFNLDFRIVWLFIIYCVCFAVVIFLKLKRNIWNKKGSLEIMIKQNQLIKNWSIFIFVALSLFVFRLIVSLFIETNSGGVISGILGIWCSSIVWICIFIKILNTPEILYGYSILNEKINENNISSNKISPLKLVSKVKITNLQDSKLTAKINPNIKKYINEINIVSEQNNLYRNSKFKLTDLALKLNIPKSHLSYLFKYHSEISFSDYKKITRIQDALKLIEAGYLNSNTFESLAIEVGFASYNPFFTSFKDIVGKTPNEYYNTI